VGAAPPDEGIRIIFINFAGAAPAGEDIRRD